MTNKIIGALAVIALLIGGYALYKTPTTPSQPVGAIAGGDVSNFTHFYNNVNVGGFDFATSSQGSVTYTATSIVGARVIEHIAPAATTATLPTNALLSAAGFLPNIGDTQTLYIHASTTKITLAGATGVTLFTASSTKEIAAGSIGRVDFVRLGASEGRTIWAFLTAD